MLLTNVQYGVLMSCTPNTGWMISHKIYGLWIIHTMYDLTQSKIHTRFGCKIFQPQRMPV